MRLRASRALSPGVGSGVRPMLYTGRHRDSRTSVLLWHASFGVEPGRVSRKHGGEEKMAAIYLARKLSGLTGRESGRAFGPSKGKGQQSWRPARGSTRSVLNPCIISKPRCYPSATDGLVVERADVRMRELRDRLRLPLEALARLGRYGEMRRQDLDRDLAAQPRVPRPVHFPHPASPIPPAPIALTISYGPSREPAVRDTLAGIIGRSWLHLRLRPPPQVLHSRRDDSFMPP
jgi:hypothetical protein